MVAAQQLRLIVQQHFTTQYQVVELTPSIATLAGELCDRQPLRAYDAVQLASAISILPIITQSSETSLTFLSADDRLLNSAQLEHLQAANPNHYSYPDFSQGGKKWGQEPARMQLPQSF
jgi:uncharacterized protein